MKCHGNAHDDEPFHMETYMAQHFNLYFCLRNFSYNEVVLCSSYLKNPFSLLKSICFSFCTVSVNNCLFDFSIQPSSVEVQLSVQQFSFLPQITLSLLRSTSKRQTTISKKSKIDIAQKCKKKRRVENRNYRQSQVVRTFASE